MVLNRGSRAETHNGASCITRSLKVEYFYDCCRLLSNNLKIKIYKTIILPVVPYGCETWSFTLRVECRLRVFENWILRLLFGPKSEENVDRRMFQNEELDSSYVPFTKYGRISLAGYVSVLTKF